jgi:hypothetical protein
MNDDQLAMIMARTDAAASLLMAVLVEKGIVSIPEMSAILDSASDAMGATAEGAVIASVFVGMRAMLNRKQQIHTPEEEGVRTLQ